MKKAMYCIAFDMLETCMSTKIEISKSEFEKQLSFLKKQVGETQSYETPVEELVVKEYETSSTYETIYYAACGCATTYLYKTVCKDGFCIKPKKDR